MASTIPPSCLDSSLPNASSSSNADGRVMLPETGGGGGRAKLPAVAGSEAGQGCLPIMEQALLGREGVGGQVGCGRQMLGAGKGAWNRTVIRWL